MIVVLLLIIIAILLFGSSAVLGVIGWIAGLMFSLIAIAMLVNLWASLSDVAHMVVLGAAALIISCALALMWLIDHLEQIDRFRKAFWDPSKKAKEEASAIWRSFDKSVIDKFSRPALKEAHQAVRLGKKRKVRSIYDRERKRIEG